MKCWQCFHWYPEAQLPHTEGINYCAKHKRFNVCPYRNECPDFEGSAHPRDGY